MGDVKSLNRLLKPNFSKAKKVPISNQFSLQIVHLRDNVLIAFTMPADTLLYCDVGIMCECEIRNCIMIEKKRTKIPLQHEFVYMYSFFYSSSNFPSSPLFQYIYCTSTRVFHANFEIKLNQLISTVLNCSFCFFCLFPDKSIQCKDESQTALVVFRGNFSNNR